MSDQNTTYVEQGLDRLLDQFNGSVNLRLLTTSYLNQVQELEDAAYPLLAERSLANATGDRLDGFGAIVNTPRGGLTDDDYRLVLQGEFAVLISNGTEEDILTVAQLLIQMAVADYEFLEYFPKTVYLRPVDHIFVPAMPMSEWFYDSGTSGADEYVRVHDETQDTFDIWIGENDADSAAQNTALAAIISQDFIRITRLDDDTFFDAQVQIAFGDQGTHYRFLCASEYESSGFAWPSDDTRMSVSYLSRDSEPAKRVATSIRRAVSAGTTFLFVYSAFDDANTFTLSSLPTTVQTSTLLGLAPENLTTGGHLAGGL